MEGEAVTLDVQLTGDIPAGQTITVSYSTANGTGTSGSDYEATAGNIQFTSDSKLQQIVINLLDDNLSEGTEIFNVDLVDVTFTVLIPNDSVEVDILDNDASEIPVITILPSVYVASEGGSVTITVEATDNIPAGETVRINYGTSPETASLGADYEERSGTFEFTATNTSETITIPLQADNEQEGNETFVFSIVTADLAQIISVENSAETVTIIDNYTAPDVSIAIADVQVNENDSTITLTVSSAGAAGAIHSRLCYFRRNCYCRTGLYSGFGQCFILWCRWRDTVDHYRLNR